MLLQLHSENPSSYNKVTEVHHIKLITLTLFIASWVNSFNRSIDAVSITCSGVPGDNLDIIRAFFCCTKKAKKLHLKSQNVALTIIAAKKAFCNPF